MNSFVQSLLTTIMIGFLVIFTYILKGNDWRKNFKKEILKLIMFFILFYIILLVFSNI